MSFIKIIWFLRTWRFKRNSSIPKPLTWWRDILYTLPRSVYIISPSILFLNFVYNLFDTAQSHRIQHLWRNRFTNLFSDVDWNEGLSYNLLQVSSWNQLLIIVKLNVPFLYNYFLTMLSAYAGDIFLKVYWKLLGKILWGGDWKFCGIVDFLSIFCNGSYRWLFFLIFLEYWLFSVFLKASINEYII